MTFTAIKNSKNAAIAATNEPMVWELAFIRYEKMPAKTTIKSTIAIISPKLMCVSFLMHKMKKHCCSNTYGCNEIRDNFARARFLS